MLKVQYSTALRAVTEVLRRGGADLAHARVVLLRLSQDGAVVRQAHGYAVLDECSLWEHYESVASGDL